MTLSDVHTPDVSSDALESMLRDPEIRQSLAVIVANAPTLAALASMSSMLLQRGPEIADNVNHLVRQLREETSGDGPGVGELLSNVKEIAPLAGTVAAKSGTIESLLDSPILRPEVVEVIGRVGEAAVEADHATSGKKAEVGGAFAILRELKDPNVQEALAFLFAFARAFGRRQIEG